MTAADAPLCVNCRHYGSHGYDGALCRRPLSDARSPVDGGECDLLYAMAWNERRSERTLFGRQRCGPSARFFEPFTPPGGAPARPSR